MLATIAQLKDILNEADRKVGFTCSCFDLFHAGHMLMLKDAKSVCDILVIGLQTDPTIDQEYRQTTGNNKNKPIQSYEERLIQVQGCRYIDYIVEYETETDLLKILQELQRIANLVRILGTDWRGKAYTGHELPIKIYWHSRDHDYSSSNLRKRIHATEEKLKNLK